MATPSLLLIQSLRNVALKLAASDEYQWGHMGACNCGFLAQEITKLTKKEIHSRAMCGHGDWSEQLRDYCPHGIGPMDTIIDSLLATGLDREDLANLERLSDPTVLENEVQPFVHNSKPDVVRYLLRWASLMEACLLGEISLPELGMSKRKAESQVEQCALI